MRTFKGYDAGSLRFVLPSSSSWVSKTFLENAPCQSARPRNSASVLLLFRPLAFSPPSLRPPTPGQLLRLPGETGFKHLQGSEPLLWSLAVPASPGAQADPHRTALIRCRGDCGARDAPAPRGARRLVQPQSVCSRGRREQRCSRGTDARVPAQRPRGQQRRALKARTMQATADSTKMDCVWSNWKSQGILFISVVHACGAREPGTRNQPLCIISPVGPMHALYPRAFCWGGVNLLCQKSEWMVFGFLFLFFTFPILKKKGKKSPTPTPLFSCCQATVLNNASFASSWSSFGFR